MIEFDIVGKHYRLSQDDRISDIYLFGSYARNEQDDYSDIDILIVIDTCTEVVYQELKRKISDELEMPMEWISLYQKDKIDEMQKKGSYFLWHIKLEGIKLFSKEGFIEDILKRLPEYSGTKEDLEDYSIICKDILNSMGDKYLDITYELSVLASIIRNTAIAIDFLYGKKVFGRMTSVETCNNLLKGHMEIPIQEYAKLYENRLYENQKISYAPKMTLTDVRIWIKRAEKLLFYAKEACLYERKHE